MELKKTNYQIRLEKRVANVQRLFKETREANPSASNNRVIVAVADRVKMHPDGVRKILKRTQVI